MKVLVDLNVCTGHARCQVVAPQVFSTDEVEGKAIVLLPDVPQELEALALRGARACPERAVVVLDNDNSTTIWPPKRDAAQSFGRA